MHVKSFLRPTRHAIIGATDELPNVEQLLFLVESWTLSRNFLDAIFDGINVGIFEGTFLAFGS